MKLIPLNIEDPDIPKLKEMMLESKYFSISDAYFAYVTGAENVSLYKIVLDGEMIGGLQCEDVDHVLYLAIIIASKYRRRGHAEQALKTLLCQSEEIHTVKAHIEETNLASIALFEKLGFERTGAGTEYLLTKEHLFCKIKQKEQMFFLTDRTRE